MTSQKNPYMWDESAASVTSPVVSMNLYDEQGAEIVVSDLDKPIAVDIATGFADDDHVTLVTPYLVDEAVMYYHEVWADWNITQALTLVLTPDSNNHTLEVWSIVTSPTAQ